MCFLFDLGDALIDTAPVSESLGESYEVLFSLRTEKTGPRKHIETELWLVRLSPPAGLRLS